MADIKPEQTNPSENAELRAHHFPADERGDTTSFASDGAEVLTHDGPHSPHVVPQDDFWDGVENADQTPHDVENMSAPLNPQELPGQISNRGDNTGDTESSVLV